MPVPNNSQRSVLTVSELNRETKRLLESSFPLVWVEGELSNITHARSGHLYFTLKDRDAAVSCAMFRGRNIHLDFTPQEGMQVLIRARVTLYEARGSFQLVAEHMEESGTGALRRAFEALKNQLANEGLFDDHHKQPLPALPRRIGVITSPTGAAIKDILIVLKKRFAAITVILYPAQVQGEGSAEQIASAIRQANQRQECDVLIVGRGGGSLEDLWAFNEEVVARAIFASRIPIVSAVGHEIDFTIADFVADHRAPTPSAAAEYLSPDGEALAVQFIQLASRLRGALARKVEQAYLQLHHLSKRIRHPGHRLHELNQRLDELDNRLFTSQERSIANHAVRLAHLQQRLQQASPMVRLQHRQQYIQQLVERMKISIQHIHMQKQQRMNSLVRALDAISPLSVLGRGYAIVSSLDGKVIRDSHHVKQGEQLEARLNSGKIIVSVDKTQHES
ncbi:MAG: exodeoxyribonuclease VII large subunit [Gammaproteobacteria bacterium]|nr:exodeoxyribonuclease VII large subunit [Gammaproteobacteria bacterium]